MAGLKAGTDFFKACIAKHVRGSEVEWDELVPLAVSAYNFFPCQSSKESPFLLMFRRDPITPVAQLLEPKLRYYGKKGNFLQMDSLRRLYAVVAENLKKARKSTKEQTRELTVKINDLVLVKDPDSAVFEPRYQPNFRVTAIYGKNRIEVQDEKGNKSVRRSGHVKLIEPVEKVIQQLPPKEVLEKYGRSAKLLISAKDIPDVGFPQQQLEEDMCEIIQTEEPSECPEHSIRDHRDQGERHSRIEGNEDYEHSIPSKCGGPNPLSAERSDGTRKWTEGFEHSTPSGDVDRDRIEVQGSKIDQEDRRQGKMCKDGSTVSVPNVNWFALQIAQFVKAQTGIDTIAKGEGPTETPKTECSTVKTEFSFFNGI